MTHRGGFACQSMSAEMVKARDRGLHNGAFEKCVVKGAILIGGLFVWNWDFGESVRWGVYDFGGAACGLQSPVLRGRYCGSVKG